MMNNDQRTDGGRRAENGGRTNIRGETPTQAFGTAVVEAFAPLLRDALQGREVSEEEARERLERQLEGRGFEVADD